MKYDNLKIVCKISIPLTTISLNVNNSLCYCSNVIDWFSDKSSFLYHRMSYQIIVLPKIAQKNHNTHTDDT